jgi:DNA polymerase I-like protein with 3'-5' exonuclease and polymerase domains
MVRSQHAALNTLLQSAGAIVMKQALINLDTSARAAGLDFHFVGNVHDEIQTEVREDQAGRDFNLRCPLSADYKVGNNWSETH